MQPPADLHNENVLNILQERDVFLHHPYESFQPVVDLMMQAAED
ncbi:hypothetical protein HCN83_18010, partial [Bacillus luteus]|nr:hypothetical protein [Alkalicoccus luteus]